MIKVDKTQSSLGGLQQEAKVDTGTLPGDLMDHLSPKEAIRGAYIPIIMVKAAFRYKDPICKICVDQRLPYNKQTRMIKQAYKDWLSECTDTVSTEVLDQLEDQLNDFLAVAGWDVECLWWVINQELKKLYPELDAYELLTDVFACLSLLDYTRCKEDEFADLIKERTGTYPPHPVPWYLKDLRSALEVIYGKYHLDPTPMIQLAIKVIDRKVNDEIFTDVEISND